MKKFVILTYGFTPPTDDVQRAWEEHGATDTYPTLAEVRAAFAEAGLRGARVWGGWEAAPWGPEGTSTVSSSHCEQDGPAGDLLQTDQVRLVRGNQRFQLVRPRTQTVDVE